MKEWKAHFGQELNDEKSNSSTNKAEELLSVRI
jgi:hypothetical protein